MTPPVLYDTCHIRPMLPKDLPEVMELEQLAFTDPWPASAYTYELFFNPLARYYVLTYRHPQTRAVTAWLHPDQPQERLIGFGGLRLEQGTPLRGHISTLAVHPDWRGHGLGEWVLQVLLKAALTAGAQDVVLEVRVNNHPAQALYAKYGFEVLERIQGYYPNGEDAFYMLVGPLDAAYRARLQALSQALEARLKAESARESTFA